MADEATVRVIVNALTEAAEQNIDDVGDEITGLGDDAAIGQTALDQLSDEFGEATAQSMILQSAMDELDDEMTGAGNSALYAQTAMDQLNDEITETTMSSAGATGALTGLQAALSGSAVASKALSAAFYLSLIPAILTLSTVLAPIVAALAGIAAAAVALAGAFGAIVGSGILAFGQEKAKQNKEELAQTERLIAQYESLKQQTGSLNAQQQQRLEQLREKRDKLEDSTSAMGALQRQMAELKEELVPIIAQFGEQFVPLIKDAINAIPTLVQNIVDAVGGTEEFRQALRDFGGAMMEVLPALVGFMFDLARAALPYAREFFGFLQDNGPAAMDAIFASMAELEPEFRDLLDALIDMAPVLLEFGTNVAEVVLPALTDLIRAATGFMEFINGLEGNIQDLAITGLILAPVLLKLLSGFSSLLQFITGKGILTNLGRLVFHFTKASTVTGLLTNAVSVLGSALSSLVGFLTGTVAGAAILGAALGLIITKALDMLGVFDIIGDGAAELGDMIGAVATDILLAITSLTAPIAALGGLILGLINGDLQQGIDNAVRILGIFGGAWGRLYDRVAGFLGDIADLIDDFLGNSIIPDKILSGLNHIATLFKTFFLSVLPDMVIDGVLWIADTILGLFTETLPQMAVRGLGAFVALVEQQFNRVFNVVADIWNALVGFVADATEQLINAGISAINSFLETLDDVGDKVGEIPGVDGIDVGTLDEVSIDRDIGQVDRRETDYGALREQRTQQAQNVIQGGVNIDVDASDNVGSNPYQWSRRAAQQLQRETRQQYGASQQ